MKKMLLTAVAAVLTGILLAFVYTGIKSSINKKKAEEIPENQETTDAVNPDEAAGCYVTRLFAYTGEYNENGETVHGENTAAIQLCNTSGINYRYAEVTVKTENGEYSFLATSLFANTQMTVIEKNGASLPATENFVSAEIVSFDIFEDVPSLHEDEFNITLSDNSLTVKNVSGEDTAGEVCVYLKTSDVNGYFGGITYRMDAGKLAQGDEITLPLEISTDKAIVPVFITVND